MIGDIAVRRGFSVICSGGEEQKGKRKVQGVPQLQTTSLARHQEEEETDKTKQVQITLRSHSL